MRAGYTRALRRLILAADPGAQEIVQVRVVTAQDIKDQKSDWDGADDVALVGYTSLPDGGVKLLGMDGLLADISGTDDQDITDLDALSPLDAVFVEWNGTNRDDQEIKTVTVRVDPDTGAGREVEKWVLRLFRLAAVGAQLQQIKLTPIGRAEVAESGSAPHDINFNLVGPDGRGVLVGGAPELAPDEGGGSQAAVPNTNPTTVFVLLAIKGDGEGAANASWRAVSGGSTRTDGVSFSASHVSLSPVTGTIESSNMGGGGDYTRGTPAVANMPFIQIRKSTFSAATPLVYSNNPVDVGATPSGQVEFTCEGEYWSDSSILFEARAHPAGSWFTVADGDIAGQDNRYTDRLGALLGNDLTAMPVQQTYDLRLTLNPSSSSLQSPVVRRFGVTDLGISDYANMTVISGSIWGVDALTLKAEVTECNLRILKTGERDYNDYFTRLFAKRYIGQIQFRLYWGHTDPTVLARKDWLHVDTFDVDDYTPGNAAGDVQGISALQKLRRQIPAFVEGVGGDGSREPIDIGSSPTTTIGEALDEVVDSLIALQGRYRGPLIPSTVTDLVKKIIKDSDGKDEADRLVFLAGYALISSQGRIKAVQMMEDQGAERHPIVHFTKNECKPINLSPGFRARVAEYFTKWGWSDADGQWTGEVRKFNGKALDLVPDDGVDTRKESDDETSKWIGTRDLAAKISQRQVDHLWFGLMPWEIQSTYRHPELEPGDVVTVETDQFVGKSPIDGREIKGLVSARATILQQIGHAGDHFICWVKSFDDIIISDGDVDLPASPYTDNPIVIPELFLKPYIEDNVGKVHVEVYDPQARVVDVRYKQHAGGGAQDFQDPEDGTWSTTPYTLI